MGIMFEGGLYWKYFKIESYFEKIKNNRQIPQNIYKYFLKNQEVLGDWPEVILLSFIPLP